jgi:4'-phosphopantetheinyl transferase
MHHGRHPRVSADDVHDIQLYIGRFEEIDTPAIRAACWATLCEIERSRVARFVFEKDRHQYVLAHGLLRAALSRRVPDVERAAWRFRADAHGRPFIAGPLTIPRLYFSLSHTQGCVACVISKVEAVGVDVEAVDRGPTLLGIADYAFSAAEIGALRGMSQREQVDRALDFWTLKEAYAKARGLGLHLPFDQFTMLIGPERNVEVAFAPAFGDDPGRWRFHLFSPASRLRLAVADGSGRPGGLPIDLLDWPVPTGHQASIP